MRIVTHERTGPYKIKIKEIAGADKLDPNSKLLDFEVHFCGCGLSQDKPFCDGSHKVTRDEEPSTVYAYNEKKDRVVVGRFYKHEGKI